MLLMSLCALPLPKIWSALYYQNMAGTIFHALGATRPEDLCIQFERFRQVRMFIFSKFLFRIWSLGDYQLYVQKTEFKGPPSIGQAIQKNLPESEMMESSSVTGPGFVNITLPNKWIAKTIQNMLEKGIGI
ncbi:uncharacterized protein LOC113300555 isoform X2 [Papaver somniferum]|uniref:uncharacterized protein LOC113300555 isoform X2 n=1 Tax=Papaver somniferum TaxID=3469 RepID=UPI000E6FD57F|nr:uncharacterized protein LOC113300555 isoform X2 [Papaver somniferum]